MITYEMRSPDLDRLIEQLGKIAQQSPETVETVLDRAGVILRGTSKEESPVRTGNLRRSIQLYRQVGKRIVRPGADYALYVHEGISRQRANPFLVRGMQRGEPEIKREIEKAIDSYLKQL